MFAKTRIQRPVELGPYPMERLRRDPEAAAIERSLTVGPCPLRIDNPGDPLVRAVLGHLEAYEDLREPEPSIKRAPVPDDLELRVRDIKGSAYFSDASQVGICELLPSDIVGTLNTNHTHAVVILVEFGEPIDPDNMAANWVRGNEHLLATLRAAEVALDVSGQISAMGYASRTHWAGASDVDPYRLSVLSGLCVRDGDDLINPYLGSDYALAIVTCDYELAADTPLHQSARNGRNLGYFLGASGAVSGLERWRRKRRPSHLGPYPVEQVKRVDRPTTEIFEDEVPRVPSRTNFYVRSAMGDLGDKVLGEAARWSQKHPVSQGLVRPMWALKPLQSGEASGRSEAEPADAETNTRALKALSHFMSSSITGICEIPDYCWYSHDKRGQPIEPYHKYALVVLIDQGLETFQGASGNDWISGSQSMRAYLRGAEVTGVMAAHIRELGFPARAHTSLDSHVLHVPLVLHAGLGEQARIGEIAMNPFLGPRFKTAVLTTDMPLVPDKPIDFGLQKFCQKCVKCARECPSQSIPYGDKVIFNGYETWKPDSQRCTVYRATNKSGSACGRCIKVCPLTKDVTWDGPLLHRLGSWMGINMMWLKPVLVPIAVWLDDFLGHGNPVDAKKWWLDLEVLGKRSFRYDANNYAVKAKRTNRPSIQPDKKIRKEQPIAWFPASTLPAPGFVGPWPPNRRLGEKLADQAESVEEALARRAVGGPPPGMYTVPHWEQSSEPGSQES